MPHYIRPDLWSICKERCLTYRNLSITRLRNNVQRLILFRWEELTIFCSMPWFCKWCFLEVDGTKSIRMTGMANRVIKSLNSTNKPGLNSNEICVNSWKIRLEQIKTLLPHPQWLCWPSMRGLSSSRASALTFYNAN